MGSIRGIVLKYTIFGESHGPAIGMTIDNLPSGVTIDEDYINLNLAKRRTGGIFTSKRVEPDRVKWLSGICQGVTTGAPLTFVIENVDAKPEDYKALRTIIRPSHADYTAYVKYDNYHDKRGGGMFSGRLTACYVVAGSIVRQLLAEDSIQILASVVQLGKISLPFDAIDLIDKSWYNSLKSPWKGMVNEYLSEMQSLGDSVGGRVKLVIEGVSAGIGEPLFDSVESVLSGWLFSIPGLKALSFGSGEQLATMQGSQSNDCPVVKDDQITFNTNHNGGIFGGITNGMPIIANCTFKPTSSIYKPQQSVDLSTMQSVTLEIQGRHDPAFVIRTPIVVESVAAMALYDLLRASHR